jgi:oxaloacetate decarboxylase alpha subunit
MPHVELLDETIRDGQQSLWGMRIQAGMIVPIGDVLDRTGFRVIDCTGSQYFEVLTKYVREDPWAGLDLIRGAIRRTPLRAGMRCNAAVSFGVTPDALMDCWMRRLNEHGVRSYWIYDCLFDIGRYARLARIAKGYGSEVAGTVFYTQSPVHTDEYLAGKAREIAAVPEIDTVLFYDTGGVLTLERLRTLVPLIVEAAGDKPVEFHANNIMSTSGLMYVEGVKHGIRILHTASRPLANGVSVPSTESVVRNLELMGCTHDIDTSLLAPVADHFRAVARAADFAHDPVSEYDLFNATHQVPGGMAGTLRNQLTQHGMAHRLDEVLTETARVREEMGWPIMATPFSQLVGTQAVLNIVGGERYAMIPDEIIAYAAGHYGEPPAPIQPDVLDRIHASPRAKAIFGHPPEQPTLEELHRRYGTHGDEDELILHALLPQSDIDAMRAAGPPARTFPVEPELVGEVKALLRTARSAHVQVMTDGWGVELRR